jgi:hypothetical protein
MKFSKNLPGILLVCLGVTALSSCGKVETSTQMGGSIQGTSLSLSGATSTLAGTAGISGSADGTGTSAGFNDPNGVTTDGTNLYMADSGNHTIRKIVIATGEVTTLAGTAGSSGSTDNTGALARFNDPHGITTDGTTLYVADFGNHTIRKVAIAIRVVTTLAGTAGSLGSTDGTGPSARFNNPLGITTDGTDLYVADSGNHTIRRVAAKVVTALGRTTTLAGSAGSSGSADGTGATARFFLPSGITTDGERLLVIDTGNNTVRAID